MKKQPTHFISTRRSDLVAKFYKIQQRLQKKINSGTFVKLSFRKKKQLLSRLKRYALSLEQSGFNLKSAVTGSALALALSFGATANAQVNFNQQTGADNPFDGQSVAQIALPTFVDIDDDGDMDAFTGDYGGIVSFYKNIGTASADFELQDNSDNPLSAVNGGYIAAPTFVDIDGDGDMDAFLGQYYANVKYFENIGTATDPVFEEQTGANNPLNALPANDLYIPEFVDIDADGDMDFFAGDYYGSIIYYKNEGDANNPSFVAQSGADNPLNSATPGYLPSPAFGDFDDDGDIDLILGTGENGVQYYENTGSNTDAVFTQLTGINNPLSTFNFPEYAQPASVDIDDDGDMDLFVGEYLGKYIGTISYYKNEEVPLAFPDLQDLCLEGEIILELGGAVPFGGVYSGNGVTDLGDGMGFSFDPTAAGVGTHTVSYTVNNETVTSDIDIFDTPTVTMSLDDDILVNPGMLPTGLGANVMPEGGVFTDINGDITDDGNGSTFSLTDAPDFTNGNALTYTFTDANGCVNSVTEDFQFVDQTVNVAELAELGLEIYPNPTAGRLLISSANHEIAQITVFDINGKLMLEVNQPNQSIDLSTFTNGLYVLRLSVNDQFVSTTIIKE